MKPEARSNILLGATRSKGKMFEYNIPTEDHISLPKDPARLFLLSLGILGDFAELVIEGNAVTLEATDRSDLLFAAQFLEAFYLSRLEPEYDAYLESLISATYYICDLPGSSLVYSKKLRDNPSELQSIEFLNQILLKKEVSENSHSIIKKPMMRELITIFLSFSKGGARTAKTDELIVNLRNESLRLSESRDLLVIDIALAIIKLKMANSVWSILPEASNIPIEKWTPVFQKTHFIDELWPSQKILAKHEVFGGKSATIQMPTSAGKTKSTEIVLRSFFFRNSTQSAVVVAPFKALCHEISDSLTEAFAGENISVNEFTDVFQKDYSSSEDKSNQIIITTPEKLVYILRQDPELADYIGALILDEGHQFDSGIRGVTYELLITNLRRIINKETQVVLISAVLANADSINRWLNSDESVVISGNLLSPTKKTVGFVNWATARGQIQYVDPTNINADDFFVPRVIERTRLMKKPRERKIKYFPAKDDGSSVALYLGMKLVHNGCIAIFCGVKSTALKTCELVVDLISRNQPMDSALELSDSLELGKISNLYFGHLGTDSPEGAAANHGILTHHASIPHGLRLSVEYALREEKARFVVCTSTLAQGVNLPIRYLIFTNIYQAGERLSVRDFHNLSGRAGRSGMHTEGTILFSNPEVYEKRLSRREGWRWRMIQNILQPENSEPCGSSLLSIFDPIRNSKKSKKQLVLGTSSFDFLLPLVNEETSVAKLVKQISDQYDTSGFDTKTVQLQFNYKLKILQSIEGFLLDYLQFIDEQIDYTEYISELAKETLAYFLASDEQKRWLIDLFLAISKSIQNKVADASKRAVFSKTLLGIDDLIEIDSWIEDNLSLLFDNYENQDALLEGIWELVSRYLPGGTINKLSKKRASFVVATNWINGRSFSEIHSVLVDMDCKIIAGKQRRKVTVQNIVDICEGELAFHGMLILGAIIELVSQREGMEDTLIPDALKALQKSLKYGLADLNEHALYEKGYSDRIVAQKIAPVFTTAGSKVNLKSIKNLDSEMRTLLNEFPSYFTYQHGINLSKSV